VIRRQAITDFFVDHPVLGTSKIFDDLPDEITKVNFINASSEEQVWQLFFDGASRTSPEGSIIAGVGLTYLPT